MTTDDLRTRAEEAADKWQDDQGFSYDIPSRSHFIAGFLAHAAQRPSREQIARALDRQGAYCGECDNEPGDFYDNCSQCGAILDGYALAVLALLNGAGS